MTTALEYALKYDGVPLSKRFHARGNVGIKRLPGETHPSDGVNFIDAETGLTPLIMAVIQGKLQVVDVLIDRGAELEYKEPIKNRNALIIAAKLGHWEIVETLLRRGALANATDIFDMTALMHACKSGVFQSVELLVKRGAAVNLLDNNKFTGLHYACKFGFANIVEHLIKIGGAAMDLRDDIEGKTPLMFAAQFGRRDCAQLLIENGVRVNRRSVKEKLTALMLASKEGHKSTAMLLIANGANTNLFDIHGWTPLHYAASWGRKDTAQILIVEGKADVNARPDTADGLGGTTPLIIAAKGSQFEIIKLLCHYGCDVNLSELIYGKTPLCSAAEAGSVDVLRCLIDFHAEINFKNVFDGTTALMQAARKGQRGIIEYLLNCFADINILDDDSKSAFSHAKETAKVNLIPWLELECPHMNKDSLCGGPSVYLNNLLYLEKGLFFGLLHMTNDCEAYLIYMLVMLATICKRSMVNNPQDIPDLEEKISQIDYMLIQIVKARALCVGAAFNDVFIMGNNPCSVLENGKYHIKFFAGAFFNGPLALYVENDLTELLLTDQIQNKIELSFNACLKDSGDTVHGYGSYCSDMLHARYKVFYMFFAEGFSKLLLLIIITWNSTKVMKHDNYDNNSNNYTSQLPLSESIIILLFISFIFYEGGLMEEKRWSISPSIIFNYKELEKKRWKNVYYHFISNVWKLLDGYGFGVVFYSIFRTEINVGLFHNIQMTIQTMFDGIMRVYDPIAIDNSSNNPLTGRIIFSLFLIWTIFILSNCLLGYITANYHNAMNKAYKTWTKQLLKILTDADTYLLVKTKQSDGRLRVSYGKERDNYEADSLSNYSDERLHKSILRFNEQTYVNSLKNKEQNKENDQRLKNVKE
eukprot:gene6690-9174_t